MFVAVVIGNAAVSYRGLFLVGWRAVYTHDFRPRTVPVVDIPFVCGVEKLLTLSMTSVLFLRVLVCLDQNLRLISKPCVE